MGELAEEYRMIKEADKERRWNNYDKGKKKLIDSGLEFQEFANGHFRVGDYDFWATTGRFIHRATKKHGRGIGNMLAKLK